MNIKRLTATESSHVKNWNEVDVKKRKEAPPPNSASRVAVILGYYNGNKYLAEQLNSIINQSHRDISIFISDDCSPEKPDISSLTLRDEQRLYIKHNEVNQGFCKNFLNALSEVNEGFEYFAFSDQDDIWNVDKIERALSILSKYPSDKPALYCARTTIVEQCGKIESGTSPLFQKPPAFANALVQSIAGGNTMVLNKAAKDLIARASKNVNVVAHDWWSYQVISGAGGNIYYDSKPCLKYRQHDKNLTGANNNVLAKVIRLKGLLDGRFQKWNNVNLKALADNKHLLEINNQILLDSFIAARKSKTLKKVFLFWRRGIHRQTLSGTISLFVATLINRV